MFRKPQYPVLIGTLVALLALSAKLGHAQTPGEPTRRVAVATRALPRGTVLAAGDFVMRDTVVRGPVDTSTVTSGWVTRRLIGAGEVLRAPAVERPQVVSANQSIQVEYQDRDVRLTIHGVATRNAALGERIAIRTDNGRRMEGTVVAPGRVRLDGSTN